MLVATAAGRSPSWWRSGSTSSTFAAFAAAASGLRLSCSGSPAWSLTDRVARFRSEHPSSLTESSLVEAPRFRLRGASLFVRRPGRSLRFPTG